MNFEEQKQRVMSGLMYKDTTKELIEARKETVFLTDEYNKT